MKIAIMQPAFIPPASYFRLFAAADVFVVLDNVQFDRRWYTHRQQLTDRTGNKQWLTLPIKKSPRDATMIKDLQWASNLSADLFRVWDKQLKKFPVFDNYVSGSLACGAANLGSCGLFVSHFLVGGLAWMKSILGIKCPMVISSSMEIDPDLRGQDRILTICKKLGATEYINSSGGRGLYDQESFESIKLRFLPDWQGGYDSVLERLVKEKPEDIRKEMMAQI